MEREEALAALQTIQALIDQSQMTDAENRLVVVIEALRPELAVALTDHIARTAEGLFHKRRRRVLQKLTDVTHVAPFDNKIVGATRQHLRDGFAELSDRHIFQWSTFYRDFITTTLNQLLQVAYTPTGLRDMCAALREEFSRHGSEIFMKGYEHSAHTAKIEHTYAITKSLNGLQRFLELPIDLYSAHASRARITGRAQALRNLASSMLAGILIGYAETTFAHQSGGAVLPRFPRSWAHYMGFMTEADLAQLLMHLEGGDFRDGATNTVLPITAALDEAAKSIRDDQFTIPRLGQFTWDQRRLDISLAGPLASTGEDSIELQCYIDPAFVTRRTLEEAANRGVSVIVAPLRPDLLDWVVSRELLRTSLVNSAGDERLAGVPVKDRVGQLLQFALSRDRKGLATDAPLSYNFARDFPLQNPFLTKYFHVYRASVRRLLNSFERRNGVRLWCSVRRSGKTTACFDLESTTGTSTVVSQTCERTAHDPGADLFYERFSEALESSRRLSATFVRDTIAECSQVNTSESQRFIFVLDEYETLFERMRLAVKRDRELRYTVVQPLLNQFVAFARDNMVVFIGQRPDAHFILMDQNQLSPYVQQDPFPLFEYEKESGGEFRELVRKVLTERVTFEPGFIESVYAETAGHPYLTVSVLISFVDWLIYTKRSTGALHFTEGDFASFADDRLTPAFVSTSAEYMLFRQIVTQALAESDDNPWLHAVYTCLRYFGESRSASMLMTRDAFDSLVVNVVTPQHGYTGDQLLSTAGLSNFLAFDENSVRPRIPLLARIAAVCRGPNRLA
jgi:hypothetical protein